MKAPLPIARECVRPGGGVSGTLLTTGSVSIYTRWGRQNETLSGLSAMSTKSRRLPPELLMPELVAHRLASRDPQANFLPYRCAGVSDGTVNAVGVDGTTGGA